MVLFPDVAAARTAIRVSDFERFIRSYVATINSVDDSVGRLYAALERSGDLSTWEALTDLQETSSEDAGGGASEVMSEPEPEMDIVVMPTPADPYPCPGVVLESPMIAEFENAEDWEDGRLGWAYSLWL